MKSLNQFNNVKIVYYSGTGGTEKVANIFRENLIKRGKEVGIEKIISKNNIDSEFNNYNHDYDCLILLFPVHSFNAPKAVYDWIKNLKDNTKKINNENINKENKENINNEIIKDNNYKLPTIVISVSGGGEVSPNTACRVSVIKMLEDKKCNVFYEKMIVMPSNLIVPTKYPVSKMLLELLPVKIQKILDEVEKGVSRRTKPPFIDRIVSKIGELEKTSTKSFGKHIKVTEDCNLCGNCYKNCPSNNIELIDNKIKFDSKCHMCFGCFYACPENALKPTKYKFMVIKEGYNLKETEKLESVEITKENIEKVAKGYLWKGVREYLLKND